MKYHSKTQTWEYLHGDKRVTWNSSFPENDFDLSDYGLAFFYSPYYTAEDDNLEVCVKGDHSIGWLITLSYLQERDEELISQHPEWLNKFAFLGTPLLVSHIVQNEPEFLIFHGNECCLSDVDLPSCHVFVYRLSKANKDDIVSFLPQLYDKGFYHISKLSDVVNESLFYKSSYADNLIKEEKKRRINLKKNVYSEELVKLIKNLFEKWLPYSYVNAFSRYIYLYQVVEYFMEIAFEESLFANIKKYNNKNISKNDLRKHIQDDSEEKAKIEMVFNGFSSNDSIVTDFKQNVKQFLGIIGSDFNGTTIGEHVYKIRNILVHNMRLAIDYETELNDIVECLEKLIVFVLKNSISENFNKHMVICDVSEKYRTNRKRMRKTYVQFKYDNG